MYGTPGPDPWAAPGSGPTPPPPGQQQPGYQQPGYQQPGYQQPGYQQAGYQQPGYGYPGQGPYGQYGGPPVAMPGTIPLRPLTIGNIYNGAIAAIRANPMATLGLAAIVMGVAQTIAILIQLAFAGRLGNIATLLLDAGAVADDPSKILSELGYFMIGVSLSVLVSSVATVILTGLLTSVVGRSVFGDKITIGEAWRLSAGRLPALFGYAILQFFWILGIFLAAIVLAGVLTALQAAVGGPAIVLVLLYVLLFLGTLFLLGYTLTKLALTGPAIVLERIGAFAGISRSFQLTRFDAWRVFGITILTYLIVGVVGYVISVPFNLIGGLGANDLDNLQSLTSVYTFSVIVSGIGAVLAQILTGPFSAGVSVLLYADRRMRAEAFDLVLQTEAAERQQGRSTVGRPDDLWDPSYRAGGPWQR